jgi:hypothetical protein
VDPDLDKILKSKKIGTFQRLVIKTILRGKTYILYSRLWFGFVQGKQFVL